MNRVISVGAMLLALTASEAQAARWGIANVGDAWALFLNADDKSWFYHNQDLNGQFDSLGVNFETSPHYTLTNITSGLNQGVPRAPGEQFTFFNRRLDQDVLDGGLGWSILGLSVTATELTFGGGPLGGTIDTSTGPQGWLFLANFMLSPSTNNPPGRPFGILSVQLFRAGHIIADLTPTLEDQIIIPLPVPEPASGALACASLAGLLALRRRAVSDHRY